MAFRTNKVPVLQEKSASGAVASFNTALAMPLASCNIAVNAWQEGSGDPSPSNVRPIHGFSEVNIYKYGKNLFNENWESGSFNGNTGSPMPSDNFSRSVDFIDVIPNTPYYLYAEGINSTNNIFAFQYDRNGNFLSGYQSKAANGVITFPNNCYKIKFAYRRPYDTISDYSVSLNYPSTATDYEPYVTPTTYTIQLGQEVYGAEVDVVNGVAHCTYTIVDMGDIEWFYREANEIFFATLSNKKPYVSSSDMADLKCELFKYGGSAYLGGSLADLTIYNRADATIPQTNNLLCKWSIYSDRTNFINAVTGYKLVYELAEPFDIQLTPTQIETLIGNNTIFADTGDIDLTYKDLDIAKRGNFREVFKLPS